MSTERVTFTINIDGNAHTGIGEIDKALRRVNVTSNSTYKLFDRLNHAAFKLNNIYTAARTVVGGVASAMQRYEQASRAQVVAEGKLAAVMRNTMGAGREELQGILDLTAAQQQLGVIGDEVQLAGAQELSTYLSKADSLKRLLPVMNDMLAQQYGLNATQESAATIAMMMGKVMDGQVNALSRYGYKFDEAQEKILKFGTEEERAATLAEVIASSVGGVNAALAATPDGRMAQVANRMGDINERVGALFTRLKASLTPALERVMEIVEGLIGWVEQHQSGIMAAIGGAVRLMGSLASTIGGFVGLLVDGNKKAWAFALGIAGIVTWMKWQAITAAALAAKTKVLATWQGAVAVATKAWTAAQAAFNIVASLNPIGLIVLGIGALVAAIAACIKWFDSWGETVLNCMGPIGWAIASVVRHWDSLKKAFTDGGILAGLKRIGVVLLDALLLPVQKLLELLSRIPGMSKLAAGGAQRIAALRERLDLIPAAKPIAAQQAGTEPKAKVEHAMGTNAKLEQAVNGGSRGLLADGDTGAMPAAQRSTEAVATGGQRSTSINISLKSLVESMTFEGTAAQNAEQVERDMAQTLLRVLNMAASAAI